MKKQSRQSRGVRSKVSVKLASSPVVSCVPVHVCREASLLSNCYILQYCAPQLVSQDVFSLVLEGHVSALSVSLSLNRSPGIADTLMVGTTPHPQPLPRDVLYVLA